LKQNVLKTPVYQMDKLGYLARYYKEADELAEKETQGMMAWARQTMG
jgi:hypothetical protein